MNSNLVVLSIICLSASIVISGWLISNGLSKEENDPIKQTSQHQLLTQLEVADYLGLTIEEIQKLGPVFAGEGSITSLIPYMKIGNKYYYSKSAIDRWLENSEPISVQ